MTTRKDIIEASRVYVNRPFGFAGRGKRIDCIAIPLLVARKLKLYGWERMWEDKECHSYPKIRQAGFLRSKLDKFVDAKILRRVDKDEIQPADMALRFGGFNHDHHVCILTYNGCMIEARNKSEARFPYGRTVECTITVTDWLTMMCGYQFRDIT